MTADIESGYGDVEATVSGVLGAGVVGINLEDSEAGVLVDPAVHAKRIAAARAVAVAAGISLVINARTDTYLFGDGTGTIERAMVYAEAGADVLFVPGVVDAPTVRELVDRSLLPLHVMAGPGAPTVAELAALGGYQDQRRSRHHHRRLRLSHGSHPELLTTGTYRTLNTTT